MGEENFAKSQLRLAARRSRAEALASNQNLPNRLAVVEFEPLAAGDFEPAWVETHQVQDRGVYIGDVMPILDSMEANFVGGPVDNPALDAPAGQPGTKALRMVIAAVALGARR